MEASLRIVMMIIIKSPTKTYPYRQLEHSTKQNKTKQNKRKRRDMKDSGGGPRCAPSMGSSQSRKFDQSKERESE